MDFFTQTFQELPDYDRLCRAIDDGEVPVCVTGLSPIHKAQLTLTLSTRNDTPILLLTGTEADAVRLAADINGMAGGLSSFLINVVSGRLIDYAHATQLHVLGFEGKEAAYFLIFCYCSVAYLLGWTVMKLLVPHGK